MSGLFSSFSSSNFCIFCPLFFPHPFSLLVFFFSLFIFFFLLFFSTYFILLPPSYSDCIFPPFKFRQFVFHSTDFTLLFIILFFRYVFVMYHNAYLRNLFESRYNPIPLGNKILGAARTYSLSTETETEMGTEAERGTGINTEHNDAENDGEINIEGVRGNGSRKLSVPNSNSNLNSNSNSNSMSILNPLNPIYSSVNPRSGSSSNSAFASHTHSHSGSASASGSVTPNFNYVYRQGWDENGIRCKVKTTRSCSFSNNYRYSHNISTIFSFDILTFFPLHFQSLILLF